MLFVFGYAFANATYENPEDAVFAAPSDAELHRRRLVWSDWRTAVRHELVMSVESLDACASGTLHAAGLPRTPAARPTLSAERSLARCSMLSKKPRIALPL